MSIWFSWVVISLLYIVFLCNVFSQVMNVPIKKSKLAQVIIVILFSLIDGVLAIKNVSIRPILVNLNYILILYILYEIKLSKSVIFVFLFSMFSAIGEILFVLLLLLFKVNINDFFLSLYGIFTCNLGILFMLIIIYNNRLITCIINKIVKWFTTKNIIKSLTLFIIFFLTISLLMKENFLNVKYVSNVITIYMFVLCLIALLIQLFKENSDKNQIKNKYDSLFKYAKTYEHEVVEKSKWQHEYENQLIIIRDKIDPKNKDAINYINKLLKNKPSNENTQWLIKLSKFPDIGIKGLLHYKICEMVKNGIKVYVDVIDEKSIPKELPKKHLEDNLQDISMALGVYLDNAMQAAMESDNKYLIVEFKCDKEQITIQISNTYKGKVQLDKINQERYTTKGSNHGYGLSIVKDIMDRNKYLSQEREMNGMYYVQRLLIDLKK